MNEPQSLREKVRSWIAEQGYPLEMKVASLFRKATLFSVRQSWYYSDPETLASREIDVVATGADSAGFAAVHFAIECKASKKPWVLFTSQHTIDNYNRMLSFAFLSNDAREHVAAAMFSTFKDESIKRRNLTWFWGHENIGHALAQAFDGKSDVPFSATLSAVKAALHCCAMSPQHSGTVPFVISFPVVVTSAPLFSCHLGESGDIELEQIESGFLFFQQRVGGVPPTRVAIVSEAGLQTYVDQCAVVFDQLMDILGPAIRKSVNDLVTKQR